MRMLYLTNCRLPTEKAHGLQIIKMCANFAQEGAALELIAPRRKNPIAQNVFDYYKVSSNFTLKKLPCLNWGFLIQKLSFGFVLFFYLLFKKADVIYTREKFLLFLGYFRKNFFFEAHRPLRRFFIRQMKKAKGIITISQGLKKLFRGQGIGEEKVLIASSAVDLEKFSLEISTQEARQELGLAADKKIILYSGHFYPENGPQVLAQAAQNLPSDVLVYFLGGAKKDTKAFREKYLTKNIVVLGHRSPSKVPLWLKAADILAAPYLAKDEYAKLYMSSMKIFEYMASHRPIIASDLPSIREVLNNNNALLVKDNEPNVLAQAIQKLLTQPELANQLANQAFFDVQKHSWHLRTQRVLNFIQTV